MINSPEITVLMPVHNGMPYLAAALDSVLAQSLGDFEVLIIDDHSTDGSRQVLREYAAQDSRIRLIFNTANRGLGASLHLGVQSARARWIARMDADDIAMRDRLLTQYEYVIKNPLTDVLGSFATEIDAEGNELGERRVPIDHERICALIWTCPFIHPTVIFRRDAILQAGSYSPSIRRRQDYELWFRCAKAQLRFANLPEPLLLYRLTPESFRRKSFRAAARQTVIGWKGCRLVNAPLSAYLGVTAPLVKSIVPGRLRNRAERMFRVLDPRTHAHKQ